MVTIARCMKALSIKNLTKTYDNGTEALKGIDFSVEAGRQMTKSRMLGSVGREEKPYVIQNEVLPVIDLGIVLLFAVDGDMMVIEIWFRWEDSGERVYRSEIPKYAVEDPRLMIRAVIHAALESKIDSMVL